MSTLTDLIRDFTGKVDTDKSAVDDKTVEKSVKTLSNLSPKKDQGAQIKLLYDHVKNLYQMVDRGSVDPRVCNFPLPEQSKMTYEYGARSYVTDVYPDYTWRNGVWYKIGPNLKFVSTYKKEQLKNPVLSHVELYGSTAVKNAAEVIDDSYYPVIYNGNRIFVREVHDSRHPHQYYLPVTQRVLTSSGDVLKRYSELISKHIETLVNGCTEMMLESDSMKWHSVYSYIDGLFRDKSYLGSDGTVYNAKHKKIDKITTTHPGKLNTALCGPAMFSSVTCNGDTFVYEDIDHMCLYM